MKKIVSTLSFVLVFIFVSCDKISRPIVVKDVVIGSKFITKDNKAVSNSKKVLFEDYTGQRCPNCPDGTSIIDSSLVPTYSSNIVVLAVHAGQLASPFGEFINQDFRTTAGTEWNSQSGFNITSWPTGMVNRKKYGSNDILLNKSAWTSVVPLAFNDPFVLKLDVVTKYDTTVRALNVYVKGTFNQTYTNDVKIIALYTEDGITGIQDKNSVTIDYEFEDMMRNTINGTWGTDLKIKPIAAQDTVNVSFLNFPLPLTINNGKGKSVNDKKVSVVVFAYDAVTREVLQAEKVKIR
ncbi:MAG TPA: Omp28-related outer membrane protein [Bacteroidia bacterium]|nr:Omp28-related outer membrane protein [Bacteroidia bacterium]